MKLAALSLLISSLLAMAQAAQDPGTSKVPPFKKVVLVIFENKNFDKPLSQPFFSELAHKGALLTNFHAITHPSEPNYIALTSGDTQGIDDDGNHDLDVKHIGDLLEEKGKTWKNYAEDYPGNCFQGSKRGEYVRKHTPFISYKNVSTTERCKNIVDASNFATDIKNGTLPDFSFYVPNMDNDTHDTDIVFGEKWFKTSFGPLLALPQFKDVLLIVTFDENECNTIGSFVSPSKRAACVGDTNQIYTVIYGPGVKVGTQSNVKYDHYDLLKTIEQGFGLGSLNKKDATATLISDVWK